MIDIGSIASLATSLKAAGDITKAMLDLRDAHAFQERLIDLNREIMSAQASALSAYASQAEMAQRIAALEEKVAEFQSWEDERSRYTLIQARSGMFGYILKDDSRNGEPRHLICPGCYQKREKSILQRWRTYDSGNVDYRCVACKSHFNLDALS